MEIFLIALLGLFEDHIALFSLHKTLEKLRVSDGQRHVFLVSLRHPGTLLPFFHVELGCLQGVGNRSEA